MRYAALSVTGKRLANEDSVYIPENGNSSLAIVADGMGGHKAGSLASAMAVKTISESLSGIPNAAEDELACAIRSANTAVYEHARKNSDCRGMGTTVVAVLLSKDSYIAANIGDSRLYHISKSGIEQITVDHSYVEELVRLGYITREQATTHPKRNIITKALGTSSVEHPDIYEHSWEQGDILLLCSDGFHGSVAPEDAARIIKEETDLNEACNVLVQNALYGGSTDNISVVLVLNEEE